MALVGMIFISEQQDRMQLEAWLPNFPWFSRPLQSKLAMSSRNDYLTLPPPTYHAHFVDVICCFTTTVDDAKRFKHYRYLSLSYHSANTSWLLYSSNEKYEFLGGLICFRVTACIYTDTQIHTHIYTYSRPIHL
jgi:hypothetical protein